MEQNKLKAIMFAFLAAVFYAINVPISKVLLQHVGPTTMAALLYLGAGIGIGMMSLFNKKDREKAESLTKADLPYIVGMIVLDIAAPIFLMLGISYGSSANASLLGNFEIVATTVIALILFKEAVTKRLWLAIGLITLSSILLSFEGTDSFHFSYGSLLVIMATVCWGLENNCTRELSSKSTYQIVMLKGLCSGLGALVIALVKKESFPGFGFIAIALALGFVAFGSALVVVDTFIRQHDHEHQHTFTHSHGGSTHTHTVRHSHVHKHYLTEEKHRHRHSIEELECLAEEKDR